MSHRSFFSYREAVAFAAEHIGDGRFIIQTEAFGGEALRRRVQRMIDAAVDMGHTSTPTRRTLQAFANGDPLVYCDLLVTMTDAGAVLTQYDAEGEGLLYAVAIRVDKPEGGSIMPLTQHGKNEILRGVGGEVGPDGTGSLPFDGIRVSVVNGAPQVTFTKSGGDMATVTAPVNFLPGDALVLTGIRGHMDVRVG